MNISIFFMYLKSEDNLDAYYRREMEKEMKKGFKKVQATERTIFNDEEQRRYNFVHAAFTI